MLTPLVVFALTVDATVPSVFATPAPFAFQFHATYVVPLWLTSALSVEPAVTVNPSDANADT
jgi:hypothetical protein